MKRVEIVTPVHNRREITLQCLRSLARINKDGLDVHIIIVDDGSTDGTSKAIEEKFPDVEVIQGDGNLWFTEGMNVGVRAALEHNPDYVLMINDDQVFDDDFLEFMVETAEKHPRSVVGSLLLLWNVPHKLFQVSPRWETFSGGWRHWRHQTIWTIPTKPWEVDLIVGNCLLVPVRAIREDGLMNSSRYPNFGDAEYTPRLKRRGWKLLIEPRARVFCQPNDIPPKISQMPFGKKLDVLIFNLKSTSNLRRRFYSNIDGAPTKLQGIAAFCAFFARALLKTSPEAQWAEEQAEKDLKETFASAILED